MVVTLGQQYNIGEKATVILYIYINRHEDKTVPITGGCSEGLGVVVVVVVVFTLKTVLTSIQYPSLSHSSRQRNDFPWSQANPK